MNFFKRLISAIFCLAVLAALGPKADAAVIPVADPYFDQFPAGFSAANYFQVGCGTGCAFADKPVVGWNQTATRSNCCDSGQWQIGATGPTSAFNSDPLINGTTPEPIVLRAINANASQDISIPIVAGVTYTLDVDLGFPRGVPPGSPAAPDAGSVFLTVDGHQVKANPLASYGLTQAQMQGTGNWYDFEASYTATSSDPNGLIDILLFSTNNGNGFGFFGNVQLTDSLTTGPVLDPPGTPEPATWAMLLIGFGGIAGVAALRGRRGAASQFA